MTTWTIKAYRPTAGQSAAASGGFEQTPEDTGLRLDDSVTLTSFTPVASTAALTIQKFLSHLQNMLGSAEGGLNSGWELVADNGAGTVLKPNVDPV